MIQVNFTTLERDPDTKEWIELPSRNSSPTGTR